MNRLDSFNAANGTAPTGWAVVEAIQDDTRGMTLYRSKDCLSLMFGFTCTKGAVWPPSKDWLENLQAWPKAFSVGTRKFLAMEGFLNEFLTMRPDILRLVAVYQPQEILVVGFAQGAAHATLAVRDILFNFPRTHVHGTVFASPRVYEERGAIEFMLALSASGSTFERINLWGDPVPGLPPWWLGYCHVMRAQHIGKFRLLPDPMLHGGLNYLKALQEVVE